MAKRESEKEDSQRSRGAKNVKSAEPSSADDSDLSTKAPSRVHIFKGKSLSSSPSKSDSEPLKCSSFRANRPAGFGSEYGAGHTAIGVGDRVPTFDFKDELIRLQCQIRIGKKALYDAAMKAEDLDAMIQGLRRTRDRIFKKRK